MNLFPDPLPGLFPLSRIDQAETTAQDALKDVQEQRQALQSLERQVERLTVVVVALAELLRDHHGTPAEVIESKILEVERRGQPANRGAKRCGSCGRANSQARSTCMYCEQPLPSTPFLPEGGTVPEAGERPAVEAGAITGRPPGAISRPVRE